MTMKENKTTKHITRCFITAVTLVALHRCTSVGVTALSFPTPLTSRWSLSSSSPSFLFSSSRLSRKNNVNGNISNKLEMTKLMTIQQEKTSSLFGRKKNKKKSTNGCALSATNIAFFLLRSILTITATATAASVTSASSPQPSSLLKRLISLSRIHKRKIIAGILLLFSLTSFIDVRATRRRQSLDETSEWARYANNPARRGRALTSLLMRLTPYILLPTLLSKIPRIKKNQKRIDKLKSKGGAVFADGLLRLGPLYIKIGQILSCRDKLLPPQWVQAMEKLQDRVPAKSGQDAMDLAYEAFGQSQQTFHQTFTEFDDVPLAAASLGQVHRAILYNNQTVAIKVQRPKLRQIYDQDLSLMQSIASFVDRFLSGSAGSVGGVEQSWTEIFDDAKTILYREIDYRDEADNAIQFSNNFGLGISGNEMPTNVLALDGEAMPSAAVWLRTPYVYKDLSSEQFLVMEYVPSIKISNDEKLNRNNVTQDDREYLAECLARAYLRQFCVNEFFSTDPHPGNLGVEIREGMPPRLVIYDFGQACSLSTEQSRGILDVIEGIKDMDAKRCVKAFDRMGVLKENAKLDIVERKVRNNFDTGKIKIKKRKMSKRSSSFAGGSPLDDQRFLPQPPKPELAVNLKNATTTTNVTASATNTTNVNTAGNVQDDVADKDVMPFFTLPAEYAFVARALSQMDGVGKNLDPDFDFISASAPYLVEIKGAKNYLKDEVVKFIRGWQDAGVAWQKRLFKKTGFEASKYTKKKVERGG